MMYSKKLYTIGRQGGAWARLVYRIGSNRADPRLKKKHILIVDDDRSLLGSLAQILQLEGYGVETVESGREAIEKSKSRFYDLALLDIRLPDMEGTELLAKLNDTSPPMIKIVVTGYPNIQNATDSLTLGADAYMIKPVNPETLLRTIQEKLRVHE
jgi:DNA-binding NtrC family response regulator